MPIIDQPTFLSLSGNIKDIVVSGVTEPLTFVLSKGGQVVLSEIYEPDSQYVVEIKLKGLINGLLEVTLPPGVSDVYHNESGYAAFTALVGSEEIAFTVVKGGVDVDSLNAPVFLSANFLTWQPQQKQVGYHDPEWLNYYAQVSSIVKVKGYFSDGEPETITLATIPGGQLSSINTNYGHVRGKFTEQPLYFDIWIESGGSRKTFVQRYILNQFCGDSDDLFVFENTLGGVDTIRFDGAKTLRDSYDVDSALYDEVNKEYFSAADRHIEKSTGYFKDKRSRLWALEFFASTSRYYVDDGVLRRIIVAKPTLEATEHELSEFNFVFQLAKQTKYLNLTRQDHLPENLKIIGPGDELFFLAPRLNEFAGTPDFTHALFPIQLSFEDGWRKATFADLLSGVSSAGIAPPFVTLTGDQVFTYGNDIHQTVDKEAVVLIAVEHNFVADPVDRIWEYYNGAAWVQVPHSFNTLQFTLSHNNPIWNGSSSLTIRYRVGDLYDQMTIVKLYSASNELTVVITSDYGDIFFNGNIDTWLRATVYFGGENINDTIPASGFKWTRTSSDPAADEIWNYHEGRDKKEVHIDETDVWRKAVFECEVTINI